MKGIQKNQRKIQKKNILKKIKKSKNLTDKKTKNPKKSKKNPKKIQKKSKKNPKKLDTIVNHMQSVDERILQTQLDKNGILPYEVLRTKSAHYLVFGVCPLVRIAAMMSNFFKNYEYMYVVFTSTNNNNFNNENGYQYEQIVDSGATGFRKEDKRVSIIKTRNNKNWEYNVYNYLWLKKSKETKTNLADVINTLYRFTSKLFPFPFPDLNPKKKALE